MDRTRALSDEALLEVAGFDVAWVEDPYGDPHRPTEDRIELAAYPETVALTGLFASPRWRERNDLHTEAARRLAIETQALPPDLTAGQPG
ncbi:hypothetical protein [Streptomyces sp. NPDC008092]|uniref:hypothetical protein n=1 Tax=Streptomyces sp. NPDC008092 TaxID=3364808 RepID=UPI0036EAFF5F